MARSIAAGKTDRHSRLSQFARNKSGADQAHAEKHRTWLGRLFAARQCAHVLSARQKLSEENARRARENTHPWRILHRLSLLPFNPSHQSIGSRLPTRP